MQVGCQQWPDPVTYTGHTALVNSVLVARWQASSLRQGRQDRAGVGRRQRANPTYLPRAYWVCGQRSLVLRWQASSLDRLRQERAGVGRHERATLLTYRGYTGPVKIVGWSPDGDRIASASDDSTVRVWLWLKARGWNEESTEAEEKLLETSWLCWLQMLLLYKGNDQSSLKPLVALLEVWWGSKKILELPKGGLDTLVHWCSQVSFLCLKWLCSVRCVLLFFADVRRRCCTGCCTSKRCTAVFDALREGALSVPANSLRHSYLVSEMPCSRAMCAIDFPLVWVRRTASR